jgi:hypothetical protein
MRDEETAAAERRSRLSITIAIERRDHHRLMLARLGRRIARSRALGCASGEAGQRKKAARESLGGLVARRCASGLRLGARLRLASERDPTGAIPRREQIFAVTAAIEHPRGRATQAIAVLAIDPAPRVRSARALRPGAASPAAAQGRRMSGARQGRDVVNERHGNVCCLRPAPPPVKRNCCRSCRFSISLLPAVGLRRADRAEHFSRRSTDRHAKVDGVSA